MLFFGIYYLFMIINDIGLLKVFIYLELTLTNRQTLEDQLLNLMWIKLNALRLYFLMIHFNLLWLSAK